jgi:hypothetical protein
MADMPTILAIGCPKGLVLRCWTAAGAAGAMMVECTIGEATTVAARLRPLAIVLLEELYEFDPRELEALARDVQSSLAVIHEQMSDDELVRKIGEAASDSRRRRAE